MKGLNVRGKDFMEHFVIQIDEHLTSYRFYHSLFPKLHFYAKEPEKKTILFDFTETKSVSPLVIPNLLCVGYIIMKNYKIPPTIFVPDNSVSDRVRTYLHDIDFVKLAKSYGLFSFTASIDYRTEKNIIGRLCTTREFDILDGEIDEGRIKTRVSNLFGEFFTKYLAEFQRSPQEGALEKQSYNEVEDKCVELIMNALDHGKSFAFMTAQVNYTYNKIYISISDCGIGFRASINNQIEQHLDPFANYRRKMNDELEAIVHAIFVRAEDNGNKIYGLYPLVMEVLKFGGTIRIHSMDTQLILTPKLRIHLAVASSKKSDIDKIRSSFLQMVRKQNTSVYRNMKCGGSHIEIELPLRKVEV